MGKMSRTVEGFMVMKNGMGWGLAYEDGNTRSYGWVDPIDATISDPKFCTRPSDLTYRGSRDAAELETGRLVKVRKVTEVTVEYLT